MKRLNFNHCFHIGRQFDSEGNMKQWWNNATITAFRNRAQCIIDQYSRYKVNELGLYMNGKLTQSENIADNGGLKQAFRVGDLLFDFLVEFMFFGFYFTYYFIVLSTGVQEMGKRTWERR